MKRVLPLSLVLSLSILGCKSHGGAGNCGDLSYFDLSKCTNRGSLGTVNVSGYWNVNPGIDMQNPGTMSLANNNPTLSGEPAVAQINNQTFYVNSAYYDPSGNQIVTAIAGCEAPDPDHVTGTRILCVNNSLAGKADFTAAHIVRRAGESEAHNITLRSELRNLHGLAVDVFVSNGYAYLTSVPSSTGPSNVSVFNVQDPAHPFFVTEISGGTDTWEQSVVAGNALYIASENRGVVVYDVTDPTHPAAGTAFPSEQVSVHALSLDENHHLFVAQEAPAAEVLIYDVTTPLTPTFLQRFTSAGVLAGDGTVLPRAMTTFQNKLYINQWQLGLVVADISPLPQPPTQISDLSYPGITSNASAAGTIGGKTVVFEASEGWGAHLRAFDATNPAALTLLSEYSLRPEVSIHNFVLSGTKLYIAHYQDGLRVVDASNPATLAEVGYFNTWRETDPDRGGFYDGAISVRVPGDGHIYVAETARGLMIFDETAGP